MNPEVLQTHSFSPTSSSSCHPLDVFLWLYHKRGITHREAPLNDYTTLYVPAFPPTLQLSAHLSLSELRGIFKL